MAVTDFPQSIKMTPLDAGLSAVIVEERCLGAIRRVIGQDTSPTTDKLQQLWQITKYKSGAPILSTREWRDVPTVYTNSDGGAG